MDLTRTQAIASFLKLKTHEDLAAMYSFDMEVQVNVARDQGQRVDGGDLRSNRNYLAFTDGIQTWKSFRVPFNAATTPTYEDSRMNFSLLDHAEGVGMTGWDWKNLCSRWVAFDFDAAVGHSDRHAKKLTDEELKRIQEIVSNIPFVTVRRSTSGRGLHLYVFLEPVHTENHGEHAAVARSILSMLSGLAGFNFEGKVDICGGNMWVWHRKMEQSDGQGLKLLKQGCKLEAVPANWKDYINTVGKKNSKVLPNFVYTAIDSSDPDKLFETLTSQRARTELDAKHRTLIQWLADNGATWWWDNANNMLVTHTYHLLEAHTALALKGDYKTLSTGTERGCDHNCFAFPLRDGAWTIRRFSPGTKETDTWHQDGAGWTRCYYNRDPDIHNLARLHDGVEHEKGGYTFQYAEHLLRVLTALGISCPIPAWLNSRKAGLKPLSKDGKMVIHIDSETSDNPEPMKGWINERNKWRRVIQLNEPPMSEEDTSLDCDDVVRHVTSSFEDAGWIVKSAGRWVQEPIQHAKLALGVLGYGPKEQMIILGMAINRPWTLVSLPFQPEYPGDRMWNRNAAQFAINPTQDTEQLSHPTWDKVLKHCGQGLDQAVKNDKWCIDNNILDGAEYLMLWIASMFKAPMVPTTYLAFWGPQNSGKSIFHEMISQILLTNGVVRADNALQSQSNFNAELATAVLCVVEETDLNKNKVAYNKIKDFVTSPEIQIHKKGVTPYSQINITHWIQCSNEQEACPIFPGDTRITLVYVPPLEEMIPKARLMELLRKEAPDFLAAVLALELPEAQDRLGVPTLSTDTKARAIEKNMTLLEQFIKEKVIETPGTTILGETFYSKFIEKMDAPDKAYWTRSRTSRQLPERFPRGRLGSDQRVHYGNMTFDPDEPAKERLVLWNNLTLKRESECPK